MLDMASYITIENKQYLIEYCKKRGYVANGMNVNYIIPNGDIMIKLVMDAMSYVEKFKN